MRLTSQKETWLFQGYSFSHSPFKAWLVFPSHPLITEWVIRRVDVFLFLFSLNAIRLKNLLLPLLPSTNSWGHSISLLGYYGSPFLLILFNAFISSCTVVSISTRMISPIPCPLDSLYSLFYKNLGFHCTSAVSIVTPWPYEHN